MSAELVDDRNIIPGATLAEPFYFPSGGRKLFGWLHKPAGVVAPVVGIVFCNPFGYESVCAHASIRAFADAAAASGVPAIRFDYAGTGDSEGLDSKADQLDVWSQDILAAAGELQRRTGVTSVCLLGFRIGALLATLAASSEGSISALILVAPIISGSRYVRELQMTRLASLQYASRPRPGSSRPDAAASIVNESMEVSGFSLSPATLTALTKIDLNSLNKTPAPQILVIDRTDLPAAREWSNVMAKIGAQIHYSNAPGFVEMMMTQPHFAVVPTSMVAAMQEWLRQLQRSSTIKSEKSGRENNWNASSALSMLPLRLDGEGPDEQVTERPVFFSSNPNLFGIVTEPRSGEPRRRGVVLLNDGAAYHVGSNGMYVSLARLWARSGYFVLRLDLSGLGDSDTRGGQFSNEVFPPAAIEDISAAIKFLQDRYGLHEITVGGLCSGAYHALRSAVAGLPINRLLMVNPMNFYLKEGEDIEDVQDIAVAALLGDRMFSARSWKRVLTGQVNIWRIVRINFRRVWLSLESTLRDAARYLRIRMERDLGRELEEIAARGISVVFIFTRGEPGIDLLKHLGGSSVERLGEKCRTFIIDDGDHIFSHSGARSVLMKILSDELYRRPGQATQ